MHFKKKQVECRSALNILIEIPWSFSKEILNKNDTHTQNERRGKLQAPLIMYVKKSYKTDFVQEGKGKEKHSGCLSKESITNKEFYKRTW